MPITTENNGCEYDLLEGQVPMHGDVKSVNAIAQTARNRFFFVTKPRLIPIKQYCFYFSLEKCVAIAAVDTVQHFSDFPLISLHQMLKI